MWSDLLHASVNSHKEQFFWFLPKESEKNTFTANPAQKPGLPLLSFINGE
jgi:hypothetical protein